MTNEELRNMVKNGYGEWLKAMVEIERHQLKRLEIQIMEYEAQAADLKEVADSKRRSIKADRATLERIKELDFNAWYLYRVQHYDGFTENRFVKRYDTKEAAEEASRIYNLLTGAEYIIEGKNV